MPQGERPSPESRSPGQVSFLQSSEDPGFLHGGSQREAVLALATGPPPHRPIPSLSLPKALTVQRKENHVYFASACVCTCVFKHACVCKRACVWGFCCVHPIPNIYLMYFSFAVLPFAHPLSLGTAAVAYRPDGGTVHSAGWGFRSPLVGAEVGGCGPSRPPPL